MSQALSTSLSQSDGWSKSSVSKCFMSTPSLPGLSSMLQQRCVAQEHEPRAETLAEAQEIKLQSHKPSQSCTAPKSSRYLREIDRRAILSRIEQGEKQSALAKEYKVSRAAICNLNKHRDEVLSRKDGNPMAKHPKKSRPKLKAKPTQTEVKVHEIQSRAAALLLTTLRKQHSTIKEFRRACDRLMCLVLEEALADVPIKAVEVSLPDQTKSDGVALEHPPCAISMEPVGCPMLDLFQVLEPDKPSGYVNFSSMTIKSQPALYATICGTQLPVSLNYHNVFIMDHVVTSAEVVTAVVRQLQSHGALEAMISLVALIATHEAVEKVQETFPLLKIVVAYVDHGDESESSTRYLEGEATQIRVSTTDMILDRLEQVYESAS